MLQLAACVLGLLGALVQLLDAPWWISCATGIPCLLLLPGWAIARWIWPRASLLQSCVDATWCGIAVIVVGVTLARLTGLGQPILWGFSGAIFAFATARSQSNWVTPRPSHKALFGAVVLIGTVGTLGASHSPTLSRGLDVGWYDSEFQTHLDRQVSLAPDSGWMGFRWISSESEGALALDDDSNPGGTLDVKEAGTIGLLLRGNIGAALTVHQGDRVTQSSAIAADVEEEAHEGPVPRYLERGMTGLLVEVEPGLLPITVEGAHADDQLYVLPGQEAIWSLDRSGEAKILHYYQLLNKVENQRWAIETLESRHLTINQPPLWSYVLALPAALHDGEMGGANLLFLMVLLLVGFSGLALLESLAPNAAWGAWALPGLYVGVHFHMMVVPGSTNFPDSLYTAALLGGLGALAHYRRSGKSHRFALLGTAAGLLRYPGTVVLGLGALIQWAFLRKSPWPALKRLAITVSVVALLLGLGGLFSGNLGEWISILWFETGPEHWDNNQEALPLLQRPLEFYREWAQYQGFEPFGAGAVFAWLAAVGWTLAANAKSRWLIGLALTYSLLLCTIDHFPSHYFLPLVAIMGLALASSTEGIRTRIARELFGCVMAAVPLGMLLGGSIG